MAISDRIAVMDEGRIRREGPPEEVYGDPGDPFVAAFLGDANVLRARVEDGRFRCYSGYAGWGPGQLEREIGEGAWIVAPCDPGVVLDAEPDTVWDATLRANGIDPAALVPGGGREA